MNLRGVPSPAKHLLLRWHLGHSGEQLWRMVHIRAKDVDKKEGAMVHARDYKTVTIFVGVIAGALIGALMVNTAIGEIEFQRQADVAFSIGQRAMAMVYGPVALVAILDRHRH